MENNSLINEEMDKRKEITSTFHKNYLLEAGAGAGKTTIIVERIINHIVDMDINPSNLVAITFTKAAATELAERIQLKALERLKLEEDPKIQRRLKNVDRIFTGTIHSFCDLILREMPFHANLSPAYEIVEDADGFHENIWYNFLRDKEDEYKDKMELLYKFGIDYMGLRTSALLALENVDVDFTGYDLGDYSYEDLIEEFEAIKEKYGDLEYKDISKGKAIGKLLYGILEDNEAMEEYLNIFNNAFNKDDLSLEKFFQEIHKKASVFQEEDRYKAFIEELWNINRKIEAVPYNIATDFINMVVAYKKENYRGQLTFNELLYKASNLVKYSEEARVHLKNKYKYFYLDESQDTDPMQIELIMYLVDKNNSYEREKLWYELEPKPGSIFIVGDPKQSIYRFRRADIRIYNQVKDLIHKNGEVVYLDINFRSSDSLCNWVQGAFKKSDPEDFGFSEKSSEVQAGFKRILSMWDDSLDKDYEEHEDYHLQGVYKYDYGENDEGHVADLIEDFLENYLITEKVNEGGKYVNHYRKVKARDIMILTRGNKETGLYLRALKDRGISALLAGEKNLGDTREVVNLFALIDLLVDPRDPIKIVSCLRNSFYLDLETIELFFQGKDYVSSFIFSPEAIEKIDHVNVRKAFSYINEVVKLSRSLSPMAFVETLVENRIGVYEINKEYDNLELRDADSSLRQVIEILKNRNCDSVYRLREDLRSLIQNNVQYELPLNKKEANEALRIMNIHKAKGLEANIVILAGGDKKNFIFPDTHYVEKDKDDKSIGHMKYRSDFKVKGPDEELKRQREREFKEAEIDRLLYVAATRAQTVLIVAGATEEESFLAPLSSSISREIELTSQRQRTNSLVQEPKYKEVERNITRDLRIEKEIYPPSYILSSPSSFKSGSFYEGYKKESELKSLKVKSAKRIPITENMKINFGPRGKIYGTIVHKALEYFIKHTDNLKAVDEEKTDYSIKLAINKVLDRMEINKTNIGLFYPGQSLRVEKLIDLGMTQGRQASVLIIKQRLYKYIKDLLDDFINNEDIKEIFENSKNVFVELPFSLGLDRNNKGLYEEVTNLMKKDQVETIKKDNQSILINGEIDLLVESQDGTWTILDYKTDRPFRERDNLDDYLRRSYGNQLRGYKLLFEDIVKEENIKIDRLLVYSTYMNEVVTVNS